MAFREAGERESAWFSDRDAECVDKHLLRQHLCGAHRLGP